MPRERVGSVEDVLEGRARCAVHQGDAIAFLLGLPTRCVDAVVTDPPYSSGGMYRGDRTLDPTEKYQSHGLADLHETFEGDARDQRSWSYWCHLWLSQCFRVARPGAPIVLFSDWRQLPAASDALQGAGFVERGVAVWDKTEASRPQGGRFRAQCEFLPWGSRGPMPLDRDSPVLPGCFRVPARDKDHMTEKPLDLMRQIVKICERGGLVLDPFGGSGATAAAALLEGRSAIVVELAPFWAEHIRRRVDFDAPTVESGTQSQLGLGGPEGEPRG